MDRPLAIARLMFIATFFLGLFLLSKIPQAHAWDIDAMNAQIEDTNVIVGGVCSGTIISKAQRLVLTAYHCVDDLFQEVDEKVVDPKSGEIKTVSKQKLVPLAISYHKVRNYEIISTTEYAAKVVGSDSGTDVALIQITDTDFTPVGEAPLAKDSYQFKRGQKVFAVGNPGITFDNSITEGIISSPQRTLDIDDKKLKVFQDSASIMGGNSGGAVYNDDGEIIGTTSAAIRGVNIAFTVPVQYTKDMIKASGFGAIIPRDEPTAESAH